jgi:DNA primase
MYKPVPAMKSRNQTSFRDRIDAVKELLDPVYVVESLGFKITNETPKEVRAACIIHGGDNETAFRVNKERGTWTCFTHKCHEQFGNDMIGLVRAIKSCSFMDALDYLEELTGSKTMSQQKLFDFKRKRERQNFIHQFSPKSGIPSSVDETKLKYYKPFRSNFFINDGFSEETLDYFEIAGGYVDKDGFIRDIIPIHDDHGKLLAYSLRDIREEADPFRKYKLTANFDKDQVLYNLYRIKESVGNKPLILVEGFKSVWRLYEYGIYNVVACMGAGITMGQAALLFTYAHSGVVTFFDNDLAGAEAIGRTYDLLKGRMKMYTEFILETDENGKGLDPADLTKEQVYYYLSNYI